MPGLTAHYFNNSTLAGQPVLQRQDAAPDFEWGQQAPAPTVPAGYFSVRWQGWLTIPTTGSYSFAVRAGERVRLWVGGQKMLDTWTGTGQSQSQAYLTLAAGETTQVTLEYHSEKGSAHVQLQWMPPGQARQAIPAQSFSSESDLVVATVDPSAEQSVVAAKQKVVPVPGVIQSAKPVTPQPAPIAGAPVPNELSGVYTLKARTTGQPLAVADEWLTSGAAVAAPQWCIEPAGQGYYRVVVQGGTKVLEVLGSSSANGAALNLWPYYSGNNQLWQIKEVGDGYYSLVAKHSRKALTARVPAEGGLQQRRYKGQKDQQWRLEPVADKTASTMPSVPLIGNGMYNVSLSPNPANGISQLRYQLPENLPVGWVLYNAHGIVVRTSDYRRVGSGVHQQTLPLSALPSGDYQLHLTVGAITTTRPILIRHPAAEMQAQAQ